MTLKNLQPGVVVTNRKNKTFWNFIVPAVVGAIIGIALVAVTVSFIRLIAEESLSTELNIVDSRLDALEKKVFPKLPTIIEEKEEYIFDPCGLRDVVCANELKTN